MRLIDADKLEKLYKGWLPQLILPEDEKDKQAIETCIAVLEDAPTIDPESLRTQGEWEFDSGVDYCYKCSECEAQRPPHYIYDNYCPNCGAKMKGGNNNE